MQTQTTQQERKRPQYKRNMLELGVKDGVGVSHNDEGYVIQMPDRYPMHYQLLGKNKPGQLLDKVAPLDETQKVKDVLIFISLDELSNPKTLENVGNALVHARRTNIEMQDDCSTRLLSKCVEIERTGIHKAILAKSRARQNSLNGCRAIECWKILCLYQKD